MAVKKTTVKKTTAKRRVARTPRPKAKAGASATERKLRFFFESGVTNYVDIGACLSLVNQRHYEQGRNYVAKVTLEPGVDLTAIGGNNKTANQRLFEIQGFVKFLPNQWQLHQAWQLAKDAHARSLREEMEAGIVQAKYQDFAIGYDEGHLAMDTNASPAATNMWARGRLPFIQSSSGAPIIPNGGVPPSTTDLVFTRSVSLGGGAATRRFVAFGNSGSNFNIMLELDKARSIVRNKVDPVASAAGVPYGALITDLDSTTADYIEDDGDSAPYLIGSHNLSETFETVHCIPQKGFMRLSTGYQNMPCGLLQVRLEELNFFDDEVSGTSGEALPAGYWVTIEVKEGSYKGVHAPPMGV